MEFVTLFGAPRLAALGRAHHLHARKLGDDTTTSAAAAAAAAAGTAAEADQRARLIRIVTSLCSTGRKLRAKDIPKVRRGGEPLCALTV